MAVLTISPARAVAFAVVQRVFEEGAWADRAFIAEARRAGIDARDRGLAMQLAFGTVQRAATLDHIIGVLAGRPPGKLEPAVRNALRMGLFQIVFLQRIPAHAAVTESVELAKAASPRGAGLVNAVLRRGTREAAELVAGLPERTVEQAALKYSHPEWIAQMWWDVWGPDASRALMAAGNRAPEPAIRVNTLRTTREELARALDVPSRPAPDLPDALVLEAPFDAHGSALYAQGHFMPQSRAAQAVSHALGPRAGDRVLDCCAAPGGKTTHLAALGAHVVAVEHDPGRARLLQATAARMGADVDVRVQDATTIDEPEAYDRVLVDPPCTDLGTLALRPDARWRKQPGDPQRLARLQGTILAAAARALRPGGVLVYSTCTISPEENEHQIGRFLTENPRFALERSPDGPVWDHPGVPDVLQSLPHRDGTDGFFVARMVKRG